MKDNHQTKVFDVIRKTYVVLTPEEWVRQHIIHFLIEEKNYPKGLIEVEKQITLFNTTKRVDILVRDNKLQPLVLIECKAAEITLTQKEINQLARYQLSLQAPLSMLSNGLQHLIMRVENGQISFLDELPDFNKLIC